VWLTYADPDRIWLSRLPLDMDLDMDGMK
jgi:hypothetical protein